MIVRFPRISNATDLDALAAEPGATVTMTSGGIRPADAVWDTEVRVIRLRGAGRAFYAGYELTWAAALMRDMPSPWDPMQDHETLSRFVRSYTSLWHSPKPVVAQVHGVCIGGGSDLALCSDLIVCADDCRIGYPPARIWGSLTTAMWYYRLGLERAKRLLLTGDHDGREDRGRQRLLPGRAA